MKKRLLSILLAACLLVGLLSTVAFATSDPDSGIIFEGNNGQVNGDQTLTANLTIPAGKTLTIPAGVTLTNSGSIYVYGTLTNNGTLTNSGSIYVYGTLTNNGTLTNSGSIYVYGTLTNNNGTLTNSGSIDVDGTLTNNNGTLTNSSSIDVDGTLTNNGTLTNSSSIDMKVSTADKLKNAITSGATYIKLMDDITLTSTLDLSDKIITLDLAGRVLTGNIKLKNSNAAPKSILTLIDSESTATHANLPYEGGVINGDIELTSDATGNRQCYLYANGGTVTGKVSLNSYAGQIYCTSGTPTAFYGDAVSNSEGSIFGGMYYRSIGGEKIHISGNTVTFKDGASTYACQVVKAGEGTVVKPIEPTKAGYTFKGWYNGDTIYTFGSTESNDIILTADWDPILATAPTVETLNGLTLTYGYTTGNTLTVSATAATGHKLSYQWYSNTSASNENGTPLTGENGSSYTVPTGQNVGNYYYYCVVTAKRTDNNWTASTTSNVATVTVNRASISPVVSIEGWTYGETAKAPSVTGNLGNGTVTYTYKLQNAEDGPYTEIAPTAAGNYTVKASVAQTANYEAGTATKDFTIQKASLTVTAKDNTITYGDAPAANGVTYSGFVNNENEDVLGGTLAYDFSYSQYGDVGIYTITPKGLTSQNYKIEFQNGTLTVVKREIGIEWGDTIFTYNGEEKLPTASATNTVNSDKLTLTVTGAKTDAGTYTATVTKIGGEKAGNYKLPATTTTTFTINKANQKAPAAPVVKSKTYYSVMLEDIADSTESGAKAQYSIDGGKTWQESPEFTDLSASTKYSFVARYAETNNYLASPASNATVAFTRDRPTVAYPPVVTQPENGSVTTSPKYPTTGSTVTITPTPDEGYEVDEITVTDKDGKPVEVTDNGDGTYSFQQPSGKVTITVTFKEAEVEPETDPVKDCSKDETCPAAKFTDVKMDWTHDGIHYCVENGLMNGTSDTTFEPDSNTARAMLVTVLYRLEGEPEVGECTFSDVPEGEWYTNAVIWAAENKIVEGYDGKFDPTGDITREQFATILYRYAVYKGYDVSVGEDTNILSFVDAEEISSWAKDAMQWAVGAGLINGKGENNLDPTGKATRAEMAAILYRFCEKVAE